MMSDYRIIGLEEVVIAVKDVSKAGKFFSEVLGINFNYSWILEHEGIKILSSKLDDTQFQLMEPISEESTVYKFIMKHGEGIHHIAFRVEGLENLINRLRDLGIRIIPDKPVKIRNPHGEGWLKYIFIHPKDAYGTLIEFIEYSDE